MMTDSGLYFEELGEDFERFMSDYDVARRRRLIFEELLPAGTIFEDALEVGCGTGRMSEELVGRASRLTVTDISGKLAREVGERLGCSHSQEDACELSFEDASFDLVVSSECIEHVSDPWRALDEMARVLKEGGVWVLTTPNRLWYPCLMLAQKLRVRKFEGPEHWIWPHEVRRWLTSKGLIVKGFSGCHLLPWQVPMSQHVLPFFDRHGPRLYPVMINFGFAAQRP
jgi:ubiquinone/menaquinone biosynthesis C-methylase UbiE